MARTPKVDHVDLVAEQVDRHKLRHLPARLADGEEQVEDGEDEDARDDAELAAGVAVAGLRPIRGRLINAPWPWPAKSD